MHTNPDLKILFTHRPKDSIAWVAQDLLNAINGVCSLYDIVDLGAFCDCDTDERLDRMWKYFTENITEFSDDFYINGNIPLTNVAYYYLNDLLNRHRHDLEMIVALADVQKE